MSFDKESIVRLLADMNTSPSSNNKFILPSNKSSTNSTSDSSPTDINTNSSPNNQCLLNSPSDNLCFTTDSPLTSMKKKSGNTMFICRICEENVPLADLAKHSALCLLISQTQAHINTIDEKLKALVQTIVGIKTHMIINNENRNEFFLLKKLKLFILFIVDLNVESSSEVLSQASRSLREFKIFVANHLGKFKETIMEVFLHADSTMSSKYKLILNAVVGSIKPPTLPQVPSSNSPPINQSVLDASLKSLNAYASMDFNSPSIDNVDVKRKKFHAPSIDDFDIIKPISRGAYGVVFLAQKKATRDFYAIKVLKKKQLLSRKNIGQWKIEYETLAKSDNPFVVKLFYYFQSSQNIYLVMEYMPGGDCFSLLKNVGSIDSRDCRSYLADIVLALSYLHSIGIVHRDLKPDNLLIGRNGHLKLTDFGLSSTQKTIAQHRMKLGETLSSIVKNIDNLQKSVPMLQALGDRHKIFGALTSHYNSIGTVLINTIQSRIKENFTLQTRDAWIWFYDFIMQIMHPGSQFEYALQPHTDSVGTMSVKTTDSLQDATGNINDSSLKVIYVQDSWSVIKRNLNSAMREFYDRFFELDPLAAKLFGDRNTQAIIIGKMIGRAVEMLSLPPREAYPLLRALGRSHIKYGTQIVHFSNFQKALLSTLSGVLGAKFTPTLQEAWEWAFAFISKSMQKGLEETKFSEVSFDKKIDAVIIEKSWSEISPNFSKALEVFYSHLFSLSPNLLTLFPDIETAEQCLQFGNIITNSVKMVSRFSQVKPIIRSVGRRTAKYSINFDYYNVSSTVFLRCLFELLGASATALVKDSWISFVENIMAIIKEEFDKRESRVTTRNFSIDQAEVSKYKELICSSWNLILDSSLTDSMTQFFSDFFEYDTSAVKLFENMMYGHLQKIVHHDDDRKLSNSNSSDSQLNWKFSSSSQTIHNSNNDSILYCVGTPDYLAPEMLLGAEHGPASDWWSFGVVMFEFLTGTPPFVGDTRNEVFQKILNGHVEWGSLSRDICPEAIDLMKHLLVRLPTARFSVEKIKSHPYFASIDWDTHIFTESMFVPELESSHDTTYYDPRAELYNVDPSLVSSLFFEELNSMENLAPIKISNNDDLPFSAKQMLQWAPIHSSDDPWLYEYLSMIEKASDSNKLSNPNKPTTLEDVIKTSSISAVSSHYNSPASNDDMPENSFASLVKLHEMNMSLLHDSNADEYDDGKSPFVPNFINNFENPSLNTTPNNLKNVKISSPVENSSPASDNESKNKSSKARVKGLAISSTTTSQKRMNLSPASQAANNKTTRARSVRLLRETILKNASSNIRNIGYMYDDLISDSRESGSDSADQ